MPEDYDGISALQSFVSRLVHQIDAVIVGQRETIELLTISLLAGGHSLLVGPSGLAKTSIVRALATSLDLSFKRIQFTADLMPSDITGHQVMVEGQEGNREFKFMQGPVFGNIVLADELNRATPKTQSALLEAMQEMKVTAAGKEYAIDPPFHVLATQNPQSETEGTYPLPTAQLDRFLFQINVDYPSLEEEVKILQTASVRHHVATSPVMHRLELIHAQDIVRRIAVPDSVFQYAARLVQATRPGSPYSVPTVNRYISQGAGPRASLGLIAASQARAVLQGHSSATLEDIRHVAMPVLRHRLIANFEGEAEGINPDSITSSIIRAIDEH